MVFNLKGEIRWVQIDFTAGFYYLEYLISGRISMERNSNSKVFHQCVLLKRYVSQADRGQVPHVTQKPAAK